MGILHLSERLVGADHKNLSGGEQKRVAIARALLNDAELFFLDEPDNGLDADTRAWLNETDQTIVLVSHDPEFVAELPALGECGLLALDGGLRSIKVGMGI